MQSEVQPNVDQLYTVAEYLEFAGQAVERYEYLDGAIRPMAGESPQHGDINVNLLGELRAQLKGKPCRVNSPNTKILIGNPTISLERLEGCFSYADASVACAERLYLDKYPDVLLNPTVIFEILSPLTESFDRGEKFRRYRSHIESLMDYVLISQTEPLVEHYRRQADEQWLLNTVSGLAGVLRLASLGCELALAELYYGIEFAVREKNKAKAKKEKKAKELKKS